MESKRRCQLVVRLKANKCYQELLCYLSSHIGLPINCLFSFTCLINRSYSCSIVHIFDQSIVRVFVWSFTCLINRLVFVQSFTCSINRLYSFYRASRPRQAVGYSVLGWYHFEPWLETVSGPRQNLSLDRLRTASHQIDCALASNHLPGSRTTGSSSYNQIFYSGKSLALLGNLYSSLPWAVMVEADADVPRVMLATSRQPSSLTATTAPPVAL